MHIQLMSVQLQQLFKALAIKWEIFSLEMFTVRHVYCTGCLVHAPERLTAFGARTYPMMSQKR
jgi:hypothetical protein